MGDRKYSIRTKDSSIQREINSIRQDSDTPYISYVISST